MVGPHHDPKRLAARHRNGIVDEPVCNDIQARNHVFCQNRHPYFPGRRHNEAVESTRPGTAEWGLVGGEGTGARIEAEQEATAERGHPDVPLRVTSDLHEWHGGTWRCEKAHTARGWIEA